MKPLWLLEEDIFDEGNPERMRELIAAAGMEARTVRCLPFGGGVRGTGDVAPGRPVIAYGSLNLARFIRDRTDWRPGVWCDFERLSCRSYYARYGRFLLQREYAFLPLAEVRRRREWLYSAFGRDGHVFIRPDDNAKSFSGGPVHADLFDKWYAAVTRYDPDPALLTVVSRPESLRAEYRLVIADGEPIAASAYKGREAVRFIPGAPAEVWAFAAEAAKVWAPHPMFVMDVAETDDGPRLVEIGSVNGAGLYACDLAAVVAKATEVAVRDFPG